MEFQPIEPGLNKISGAIVDAAYQIHTNLGPGLLESIYQKCLVIELQERGLTVETEVQIPIQYKNHNIDAHIRIDLLVNDAVIVELKSVERIMPVHTAQLITYLKLSNRRLGLLINFNVDVIKDGIKRVII
jgi:GxxExxY protein